MNAQRPSTIACDVSALAPDAVAVDTLARLQLAARRLGLELRLRHVSSELQELLAFVGLRDVLRVEAGRQAEEREERLRVEEERELDDPAG
jgi:anti-anti-sigma regulatory factor